ncbi:MAG: nucleoside deaminase [Clostridia bacterium]|nr:nucleoside deaminase [Clostridia bacterium]MEE1023674.1 nucleoside deaminase [Acutalibacteraceae bacterium]
MIDYSIYMRRAIELGKAAASCGEVPVGAVIIRNGEIIGEGYNRRESLMSALAHAEIEAIDAACKAIGSWRLNGCELIVTLEPCPMCSGAIINARLDKVIYGARDDKAGSVRSVISMFDLPYNHRPRVQGGVLEEECASLLSSFFEDLRK